MTNYEYTLKNCLKMVEQNELVLIYTDEWRVYNYENLFDCFNEDEYLIRETDINELEKELQKLNEKRG